MNYPQNLILIPTFPKKLYLRVCSCALTVGAVVGTPLNQNIKYTVLLFPGGLFTVLIV